MTEELHKFNVATLLNRVRATPLTPPDVQGVPPAFVLLGEVLDVRPAAEGLNEVTLLDSTGVRPGGGRPAAFATLPRNVVVPPKGFVVGIVGRVAQRPGKRSAGLTSIEYYVEGSGLDGKEREGRLFRERKDAIERLRGELASFVPGMPSRMRTVALVTGPYGAVAADLWKKLNPNPKFQISVRPFDVSLQDADAIAAAIRRASDVEDIDAVVIARGGGSAADFDVFDETVVLEAVVYARREQKKYVVLAIGHAANETSLDEFVDHCAVVPAFAGAHLRWIEREIAFGGRKAATTDVSVAAALTADGTDIDQEPRRWQPKRLSRWGRAKALIRRWFRRLVLVALGFWVGWSTRETYLSPRGFATAPERAAPAKPPSSSERTEARTPRKPTRKRGSSSVDQKDSKEFGP